MRWGSLRVATSPGLALTVGRMAARLACGAAAVPPAAALATAAVRHGAPLVRRQHPTISSLQRRYSTWNASSKEHVHASTMWWRPQPQMHAHVRCMAAQRDEAQDGGSSTNGSDAPAENGSEQPSTSQGSGEPELGRGSLAPDREGEPPPDAERKSMTYREMLAEWFYTRYTQALACHCLGHPLTHGASDAVPPDRSHYCNVSGCLQGNRPTLTCRRRPAAAPELPCRSVGHSAGQASTSLACAAATISASLPVRY